MKQSLFTLFCCLLASLAFAQNVVRGVVRQTDGPRAGAPLGGATVSSPQASQVATTDSTGRFELRGRVVITTLTVNHLGYLPQTVRVSGSEPLTIGLTADGATTLGEAVVTSKYYRQYSTQTVSSALRL